MSEPINMPAQHGDKRFLCGQCKWFVQGYKGKTCQVTRKVQGDTQACIEFQPSKTSQFSQIEKDKYLHELRKTIMVWADATIKAKDVEIRSYRIYSKKKQLLSPMDYISEERLAELGVMFAEIVVARERLLDISFDIADKHEELESLGEEVKSYLMSQYQDTVQVLKNDTERKAFFRAAAPELFAALDKMAGLKARITATNEFLKDAHWSLRAKLDAVTEVWKSRIVSQTMVSKGYSVG